MERERKGGEEKGGQEKGGREGEREREREREMGGEWRVIGRKGKMGLK